MKYTVAISMVVIGALVNISVSQAESTNTIALPESPDRVLLEPGECASTVTGNHKLRWFCAKVMQQSVSDKGLDLLSEQLSSVQLSNSQLFTENQNLLTENQNLRSKLESVTLEVEKVTLEAQKNEAQLREQLEQLVNSQPVPTSLGNAKTLQNDRDQDGVNNSLDLCAGTPPSVAVDRTGCALDEEIVLQGITFKWNSASLTPKSRRLLSEVVAQLKKHPDVKFEIAGYTDSTGSDEYNRHISTQRAKAVRDFLVTKGVLPSKLTARGYGEESPIANNSTAAGRALNRRVSLLRRM